MDITVLMKGVPDRETLRFDPVGRTVVRSGVAQVLNPFDQRALRVALELRRTGERVGVLSLGPPDVLPPLREARALGADVGILLSDPAFAGSDVLATARALVAGLGRLGHHLVLAGARSTDSDTGLVGPEVAAILRVPVVTGARAILRDPRTDELDVTVDTPGGWATVRLAPPAVVTVGEKITKPLHVDPRQLSRPDNELAVEILGPAALGLDPALIGARGSPTSVEEVREVAPQRAGRRFAQGAVEERVAEAVGALGPLLGAPATTPTPLGAPPPLREEGEIALVASDARGRLDEGALGWFSELRRALADRWPSALWFGTAPSAETSARLSAAGALSGYRLVTGGQPPDSRAAALALARLVEDRPRLAAVLTTAEPFGRELAGQFAAARGLGAVGDATALGDDPGRGLSFVKPSFGGRTLATIRSRTYPVVATLRPGLYPVAGARPSESPLRWEVLAAPPSATAVHRLGEGQDPASFPAPEGAEVVVAVGRGIGGPDGIASVLPAVARWGAALVGTRRVVDAGWLPSHLQVGLTGRALAPRLAILLGVRGSGHHMVGWRRARAIVAVNADPAAPVFDEVDLGIVGAVEELLPLLVEPVARALGR